MSEPNTSSPVVSQRKVEFLALLFVTIVLGIGFMSLRANREKRFAAVEKGYTEKTIVDLNPENPRLAEDLEWLLLNGQYVTDAKDARTIGKHIADTVGRYRGIANLGSLNKKGYFFNVADIEGEAGEELKARIAESRSRLRLPATKGALDTMYRANTATEVSVGSGDRAISVKVKDATTPTLVQLRAHWIVSPEALRQAPTLATDSVVGYATTGADGVARFTGLRADGHYSVLPLKWNHEYGTSQGTGGEGNVLPEKLTKFGFTERAHRIRPLNATLYQQLKADGALTVRTPQEYRDDILLWCILFLAGWWMLHIWLSIQKSKADGLLLPLLMTLTGIGILVIYAIHDPLTDLMAGETMVKSTLWGMGACLALSCININKFYNGKYILGFDFLFNNKAQDNPPGYTYLLVAILLLAGLLLMGEGPEGSGVQVKLFFFQPSEVIKILTVIFFSAYLARYADLMQKLSESDSQGSLIHRFWIVFFIILALLVLMGCYLRTGDLGPALVLSITFILIYAMSQREYMQLILGVVSYCLLLVAVKAMGAEAPAVFLVVSIVWGIAWILAGWTGLLSRKKRLRRQLYGSAIFLNLVIAVFVFGGSMLDESIGQRLHDRTAMSIFGDGIWDNEVRGGDQVAQGLWGLATGGIAGQGLGEGNPNTIPAFHTDMILSSLGEELGWTGVALVVICFMLLVHRTWLIGRRSGNDFLFYLTAGIAISTAVQFFIIALGSLGIIPLTGVTVPFLSYGAVSSFVCLFAFGIVFSVSRLPKEDLHRLTEKEQEERKTYDSEVVLPANLTYFVLSIFLLGCFLYYQLWDADQTLIRPALVTNRDGARVAEYNPRIDILVRQLGAANIYDRYGALLATSQKDSLDAYAKDKLIAGTAAKERRGVKRRYYPFGNHLLFWTGDFNNTGYFWSESQGYMAEKRHLSTLRGFHNTSARSEEEGKKTLIAKKRRINRFVPTQPDTITYYPYDYSELIPALKDGIDSKAAKKLRDKQENVRLTVDARLQTELQNVMGVFFKQGNYPFMHRLRASVVVLGAKSGQLLSSANYPLPDLEVLKRQPNWDRYNDQIGSPTYNVRKAYTERDLGTTFATPPGSTAKVLSAMAGFMKLGQKAKNIKYNVDPLEVILTPDRGGEPGAWVNKDVTMEDAIVNSSNIYFINLVNNFDLYPELGDIYRYTGINIGHLAPYRYDYQVDDGVEKKYDAEIASIEKLALPAYEKYVKERPGRLKGRSTELRKEMSNSDLWGWPWGQGTMAATPLAMARAYSIIDNDGSMAKTTFLMDEDTEGEEIVSTPLDALKHYMEEEAKVKKVPGIAAKTGTPERVHRRVVKGKSVQREDIANDGWFVFLLESSAYGEPVVVAVRIERLIAETPKGTIKGGSGNAVSLSRKVIEVLEKRAKEISN